MIRTTRCGQFCAAKSPGAPKGNTNAFKVDIALPNVNGVGRCDEPGARDHV
jgi:hypothetical protein